MELQQVTTILFVVFMVVAIGWRAAETFRKQGSARGQTYMNWSFYVLFTLTCLIFGGTIVEFFCLRRPHRLSLLVAGVTLFIVANIIRIVAIRTLGRYWSLHIEIRNEQPLIREGIYDYVRHPAYLSFMLEHIAVPLAGGAWLSLALTVVLFIPTLLWRMWREEQALVEKFGESYRRYQQEVGALLPRWPKT